METLQKERHLNAVELLDTVLDPGSFRSWDTPPAQPVADVDEHPDAAAEPKDFCRRVARAIEYELSAAASIPAAERVERRWNKFRQLGR